LILGEIKHLKRDEEEIPTTRLGNLSNSELSELEKRATRVFIVG